MTLANFSWVLENKLAGSALPGGSGGTAHELWSDLEFLAGKGIRMLVSLELPTGTIQKMAASLGMSWRYFAIPDFGVPHDIAQFRELIDDCIASITADRPVCVHCRAGIGRTGMVLTCIVGRMLGIPPAAALAYVRKTRKAVEGGAQWQFIERFLGE